MELQDLIDATLRSDNLFDGMAFYLYTYVRVDVERVVDYKGVFSIECTVYLPQWDIDEQYNMRIPIAPIVERMTIRCDELIDQACPALRDEIIRRVSIPIPPRIDPSYNDVLMLYRDTVKIWYVSRIIAHLGASREQAIRALHGDTGTTSDMREREGFGI